MSRPKAAAALVCVAAVAVGCGESIKVPASEQRLHQGAMLFNQRCSGCHTLDAAATEGSTPKGAVNKAERTDGPNFNSRHVTKDDALFAIRNGGFSGAIMPANVVVGDDAQKVAEFLDRYSGRKPGHESGSQAGPGV